MFNKQLLMIDNQLFIVSNHLDVSIIIRVTSYDNRLIISCLNSIISCLSLINNQQFLMELCCWG